MKIRTFIMCMNVSVFNRCTNMYTIARHNSPWIPSSLLNLLPTCFSCDLRKHFQDLQRTCRNYTSGDNGGYTFIVHDAKCRPYITVQLLALKLFATIPPGRSSPPSKVGLLRHRAQSRRTDSSGACCSATAPVAAVCVRLRPWQRHGYPRLAAAADSLV